MGASLFVGRVGGLAVALGVGAAMFSGTAVAWADRGGDAAGPGGDAGSSSSSPVRPHRGTPSTQKSSAANDSTASRVRDSQADSTPTVSLDQIKRDPAPAAAVTAPAPVVRGATAAPAAAEPEVAPAPVVTDDTPDPVDLPAVGPTPVTTTDPVVDEPVAVLFDEPAPESAPSGDMTPVTFEVGDDGTGGAGNGPDGPVNSALADLVLASFVRRENTLGASATDSPGALVTTSSNATGSSGLTLAPSLTYFDGVIQGNLGVTSGSGCGTVGSDCKLVYSLEGTSAGGKVTFDKVPVSLPKGGAGSFTFLPYATWIKPDAPTKFPTPTGTQTFTVRVSENTKFNQTITAIPLIGLIAAPIINLLQATPFIGNLLAPIIGASVKQEVTVNVGDLAAGKQVAYTYKVTSFDGTKISMNFFPASAPSLLPALGNQQATIFNGPGLGSPGETNPYGSTQAAFSTPGLALMRGQGLPGDFASAPLGFNVITWDPRGEWDSGGILQLDNPFYEGRDVSALMDWANANTPLLNEGGKPDIAMMGGSYGGGIQMTTVDPRIKSIVPAIAWNSLNNSLYPGGIFKTAWANALAEALLLTGASSIERVNSQVTQALITGNLFAFISETAQAVLSASGPTALLTKLNIPTMYNQGTVDALFPLQQALDNARTQLEQNPFFADKPELVKMIWFCGGHGVCTTQSAEQFTAQLQTMFLQNMLWVNKYTKGYLAGIPEVNVPLNALLGAIAPFQWWDQKGTKLASFAGMPYTAAFQNTAAITAANVTGGSINSFTSRSGPLTAEDPAGAVCGGAAASACQFPLNQVFATKAKNAVNVDIPIATQKYVVGAPTVSFTYSGIGNAKAVYAQIVDNETGQVLGNINTAIPVTLDGKEHTVSNFQIANIAYTSPASGGKGLTLQFIANSALYQNTSVNWNVNISKISVSLPTTGTAIANPFPL